jgi:hypothetical protein
MNIKLLSALIIMLATMLPSWAATTWPAGTNTADQTFFGTNHFTKPTFGTDATFSGPVTANGMTNLTLLNAATVGTDGNGQLIPGAGGSATNLTPWPVNINGNGKTLSGGNTISVTNPSGYLIGAHVALAENYDSNNVFVGTSGNSTMTGVRNAANGILAFHSNTTGSDNTASGASSLYANTTGVRNTASGSQSMFYNVDGSDNAAYGKDSLYASKSTSANSAFGLGALISLTNGNYNAAFGHSAGGNMTNGLWNVFFGGDSGLGPRSAENSIGIGVDTFFANSSPTNDIAIGTYGLATLTTGRDNVWVGGNLSAKTTPTTGSGNIWLGSYINGTSASSGSFNIQIGDGAYGFDPTLNGQLNIGNLITGTGLTNGNVNPVGGTVNISGKLNASGTITATNGAVSFSRNLIAPVSISVTASPFNFTNSTAGGTGGTNNINVFVDGSGVTGSVAINGTTIFSALTGADATVPLQPGEYVTITYSIGTPVMKWKPF